MCLLQFSPTGMLWLLRAPSEYSWFTLSEQQDSQELQEKLGQLGGFYDYYFLKYNKEKQILLSITKLILAL